MPKKPKKPTPFDAIGAHLAQLIDVKRRLIQASVEKGDPNEAREILEGALTFVRCVWENLENVLLRNCLKDMTREQAQQAIHGIRIFEGRFY